ncbi:MAG TPA: protein TolQ [Caulobacteraceae bacterium]|jgi:biopolymer transport protein TolQ|nr:protein TolQ [Caulobacteraceae bacterium]
MGQGFDPDSLNIVHLFLKADWVVKAVMIGLALASLWSWAVILDKLFRFGAINRAADEFEDAANSGRSLEDLAAQAGDHPKQALPAMLVAALKDWRGRGGGGEAGLLLARIDRVLDAVIARETRRIEEGLGVLAVVATASPFIGLFGTVWGIMNSFHAIAVQQNTNLATVAPAISEALFCTALGLAAAIPAYIGYNKFSIDASKYSGRLESFADDLSSAIARRLADKAA